ncbi:MAG: RluA family pseudouridine synthase [Candidatus Binataceae bacterium]
MPERLDQFLVRLGLAPSRRIARGLIAQGRVRVNGRLLHKGAVVDRDDQVDVTEPSEAVGIQANAELTIKVLYQDSALLIVNKPALIPCHPLRADERGTVMNAIAAVYPETATVGDDPREGGLVHRLDNGTSGALIIARTNEALATLRAAIRSGAIAREYLALAAGRIESAVEITAPIAHHPKNPRKMVVVTEAHAATAARPASTIAVPIDRYGEFTLLKVSPRTGRRHQIRIHLASLGHPLAGDELYGGPPLEGLAPGRFWLHLAALELESPVTGRIRVEAPLPADLGASLAALR